jgi:predicted dehydrogenase
MPNRLRVGVIGLVRRWERYRLALTEPGSPLRVRAIYDPSARRTARVARQLQCEAADGTESLLDHPKIDAVLLLDSPWHGLWSLERACQAGKPIFCAAPLTCDEGHAHELGQHFHEHSFPVMTAFATGLAPAVGRLRVLLDKHLGPVRTISCIGSIGRHATGETLLASGVLLPALHLCGELLAAAPTTVWAAAPAGSGVVNLTFAFPDGRAALVVLTAGASAGWRIAVTAEKGTAEASLPRRLRWRDAAGEHALRLPPQRTPQDLLHCFAESVRSGQPLRPSFEDACRALAWLRAARRSHAEGRAVAPGDA